MIWTKFGDPKLDMKITDFTLDRTRNCKISKYRLETENHGLSKSFQNQHDFLFVSIGKAMKSQSQSNENQINENHNWTSQAHISSTLKINYY